MLLARVLVLFLVPAGCSSMPVASVAQAAAESIGLPAPTGPLAFPADSEQVPLTWLVEELARLTGQELVIDQQTRQMMQQMKEPLEILTPVPADEVYAFVEALLLHNDLILAPVKGGTRPILGIYNTMPGRPAPRPVVVAEARIAELEHHPALLAQVLITFENVDTRQLQTQLRQIMVDQTGLTQVVPCGDRTLLIQGLGARLAGLARVLREVDRASVPRPGSPPPADATPAPAGPQPPQGPPR